MGNGLIAFLMAIGASAWVFNKMQRSTGGNTQNSIIVAVAAAIFLFVITILVLGLIPS